MYAYKPELITQGKFPIQRIYTGGKAKADAQVMAGDSIEQEHQSSEEVPAKAIMEIPPKKVIEIPTGAPFTESDDSESTTQNDKQSTTQSEAILSNDGWVPLFRQSIKSQVFQNEGLWKVWTWCLMKASHTEQWVSLKTGRGKTEVHLLPGQFIYGRKVAAKELKMHPETLRKRMLKLKNMQNLTTQSNTHYSLVSLTKWGFYRELMKKVTAKVPPKYHPSTTYKKNKKTKDIYSEAQTPHRVNSLLPIAKRIIDHLNQVGNRNFTYSKANLEMIQARLREGHTEDECTRVIDIKWNDQEFDKKYFRPSTLFRPTKFEGYLNERQRERYT